MQDKSCLSKAVCLAHLYRVYQFDSFDNPTCSLLQMLLSKSKQKQEKPAHCHALLLLPLVADALLTETS